MEKLQIKRVRQYKPYHDLLGVASMTLEDAENKKPGYYYLQMITITFSALAIEAIANSLGAHFIDRWKDFENASPIAKLRLICDYFNIEINFESKPWSTILWLMKLRNKIAHAKPELIYLNKIMTEEKFKKIKYETPQSKLDEYITLSKAKEALESVEEIKNLLCSKIPEEERFEFSSDSWSGTTRHIKNKIL